jgi:predicted DNA-binding ribbon-helix-helix protein
MLGTGAGIDIASTGECSMCHQRLRMFADGGRMSQQDEAMISSIMKRSVVIAGHKTSVSLENDFWDGLKKIAADRNMKLSELVGDIDIQRNNGNLSSAIRLFVFGYYRTQTPIRSAGHLASGITAAEQSEASY